MELISKYQYVVDRTTETVRDAVFQDSQPINNYVMNVLNTIVESVGDREYRFQQNSITIQTWLNQIIQRQEEESVCRQMAERLLSKEIDTQERIEHLGVEIPKGILIISLVDMQLSERDEKKVVVIKADYNEIIEQDTGRLTNGLSTKKKFYKAFIANVTVNQITKLSTYDTNATMANYWWKDFLELEVIRENKQNTKNAFSAIEKNILNPIKTKSKQDYLHLWNITLGYFRLDGEFNLDEYRDNIIGNYTAYSDNVSRLDLQAKCDNLLQNGNFDRRFEKDLKGIKGKKLRNTIPLTREIDLLFKDTVPNLEDILQAEINEAGEKFLKIKSAEGYEYAKNLRNTNNE